jgi:hypothetical protein
LKGIILSILLGLLLLDLRVEAACDHAQADYEIIDYNLSVRIPDTYDRIEVDALLSLEKLTSGAGNRMKLQLGDNFRGAKMINLRVADAQNAPLDFTFNDALLEIKALGLFGENRTALVCVQYDIVKDESFFDEYSLFSFEVCDSMCHVNASITRTDNWYPKVEGTRVQRLAPYELMIDMPAHFEVMASGRLADVTTTHNRKIYVWRNYEGITDRSLYFFALKRIRMVKDFDDGFCVIMYLPENAMPENIDYLSSAIHDSYRYFESIFGEATWNEYKIMAFPYGYSGLFNSMCAPVELFTSAIKNNDIYFPIRLVIHEVSHTWWGNIVSSDADEDYWLFEGFGKYSEVVGIRPALGVDVESLSFFRLKLCTLPYIDYVPSIKNAQNADDRTLVNVTAYYMGATYLRMLRYMMGEDNFYKGIKDYVRKNRGECISTEDFISAMEKYCRREHRTMLEDYLMNPGYARFDVRRLDTEYRDGIYVHKYNIRNVSDKDIYVPCRVTSDVENYTKNLWVKKGEQVIIKVLSRQNEAADHIIVDPEEIFPVCKACVKGPGATVYENQQGEVRVYNIISDGPFANAGINEDMSLISVDSVGLPGNDLRSLNHMFLQPAGKEMKLQVIAEGIEPYEVTVLY